MCMCTYHSNFIEAVTALHKFGANIPDYGQGFVEHFLCESSSSRCWFGTCNECTGISIEKLSAFVAFYGKIPFDLNVRWMVWKKNTASKRIEKREVSGSLADLVAHISAMSSQFLKPVGISNSCFYQKKFAAIFIFT